MHLVADVGARVTRRARKLHALLPTTLDTTRIVRRSSMCSRRNGLSLCLLALTVFFIGCRIYAGLHAYNDELREQGQPTLLLSA
ncbi:hypothetical protein ADT26_16855 [Xanthomonas oryzae]|nr:hypothetical protein AXO1947_02735 [Xanthomonas oryzae pv. oryzae]KOR40852.1 hypothetical protein ADT26_16855 [Xanthomonas oryzae]AUI91827.1 hypothetical protein BVV16_19550 [Xanthomonas oryzae pv. oryzae]AUI95505.1 hypothetical protein BVV17_19580 [Xanthomonas oryzae pv. oryzae]AUI99176.1 hypothetical protein BVV18_19580 [Xanthomonas oryzae pv. oryzae]